MNISKISTNGQITVPIEIRKKLRLLPGHKVLFRVDENGTVIIDNASIETRQHAAKGVSFGILNKYANSGLIEKEKGAWGQAATIKHDTR